jgi:hypothetical protein
VLVLALLNKERKLHARIPMTALVSDGCACRLPWAFSAPFPVLASPP